MKPNVIRFAAFEADLTTRELRKNGVVVPLQEKPFRLLEALLRNPGRVLRRDELRSTLWPDTQYGEFDQGLNQATRKVRIALGDSARKPRFVETVPNYGYRFLALTVQESEDEAKTAWLESATEAIQGWWLAKLGTVATVLARADLLGGK